jgi:hypothetical protein
VKGLLCHQNEHKSQKKYFIGIGIALLKYFVRRAIFNAMLNINFLLKKPASPCEQLIYELKPTITVSALIKTLIYMLLLSLVLKEELIRSRK